LRRDSWVVDVRPRTCAAPAAPRMRQPSAPGPPRSGGARRRPGSAEEARASGGLPPPAPLGFERRGTRCGRALPAPRCGHRFVLAGAAAPRPTISPPRTLLVSSQDLPETRAPLVYRRSATNAVRTVRPGQKPSAGERNVCGVCSRFAADPPTGGSSRVRTAPVFRPTMCSVACGTERRQKPRPAGVADRTPRPEGNGRTGACRLSFAYGAGGRAVPVPPPVPGVFGVPPGLGPTGLVAGAVGLCTWYGGG